MESRERILEATEHIVAGVDDARDRELVESTHPADLAQALRTLPLEPLVAIFRFLGPEQASGVLSELDDDTLIQLVQALEDVEVSSILNRMPAEHAADIVEELPVEQAEKILDLREEETSEGVQELLDYPEQSAGRLMSPDVVAIDESATVEDAIQHIRKSISEEKAFELYVIDHHRHLVGVVPLRRLLIADPATRILAVRDESVVSVTVDTDREEVARIVAKYDLVSVPVVDAQRRLVGTITVDDVIDILREEASEDIFRIAGSDASELERRSPGQVALMRLPWILATLLIEMVAGLVIHYFDRTLAKVILLASFMPVIQAISGNTGLQSVTMVVRGLATGHVHLDRWWEPLRRQIQTSTIIGAVCAVVVGTIGGLWHSAAFGLVVAVSMFVSVNLSGAAGTAIPMMSKGLGFDPAMTAGPFETALQDVLGVTIFLSLATALLHWLA
ncbi:MAG TPA: magnesium transporter [Methylomirabilota bacterium]|nr:magnesium transporter [Methylomirabilota bacterium]